MMACMKCQGATEEGHIPDSTYGGYVVMSWVAGAPEKSFWRGLKTGGKAKVPVTALRCTACGFLEFYAKPV